MNELSNLLIKNKNNIRSFIVTILKNSDGDEIHSLEGLNKSYRHLVYKCMGNGISFNKVIDDKNGTSIEFFRTNPSVEVFNSIYTVPRNTASESSSSPGNHAKDSDEDSDEDYQDSKDEDSQESDEDSKDEDSQESDEDSQDSDEDSTDNEENVMDNLVTLNYRIIMIYRELTIMLFFLFLINSMTLFFSSVKTNLFQVF
jgi:hypothetical protein